MATLHSTNIKNKKKVCVVGAGAAGMSCAATLAKHPDEFDVTIIEKQPFAGGQATSVSIDKEKYGAEFLNDGVQGGSPAFGNTFRWFKSLGHEGRKVNLQISFGKDDGFWTNVFPSPLVERHQKGIKKFGKVLKIVHMFELVFALIPVRILMRLFMFDQEFATQMVYPLMALFLGTGNQTPNVSSAILERLFTDPHMKLWDYSDKTLLPNLPDMVVFPRLGQFYSDWVDDLREKGVKIKLAHELVEVIDRKHGQVRLSYRPCKSGDSPDSTSEDNEGVVEETFDELVMAVLADDAKALLGKSASWQEKNILGSATFFDDITVTHNDVDYMRKHYVNEFSDDLTMKPETEEQSKQIDFAKKNFQPMYHTKSYLEKPGLIEMTFNCSNYQFPKGLPLEQQVFQTIFLNKEESQLWTKDQIRPDKILLQKWWHQLGHVVKHYIKVVPWMWLINGKNNTYFAGAYTLVNMHEMAVVSGMAAAYRMGADHPFPDEDFGLHLFKLYLLLSHGTRYKPRKN